MPRSTPRPTVGGRRWWRSVPLLALVAVALTTLPGSAAPQAPAPQSASVPATAVPLPASCRPNPNPPPTEYGFVARVEGGTLKGGDIDVSGMDVSVCGVVRLVEAAPGSQCEGVQGRLIVPPDGVVVNEMKALLTVIPGHPLEIPVGVGAEETVSNIDCADSDDGITAELALRVRGEAGVFGLACRVPMTGELSATITGNLLTPPYEGETTLSGALSVGAVTNNDKYCPGTLPGRIDGLLGLPGGGYQVNWSTKVSIYQP